MHCDNFGQQIYSENDLCDLYMQDHNRTLHDVLVDTNIDLEKLELMTAPTLIRYAPPAGSIEEFDQYNQAIWFMPEEYVNMDIVSWLIDRCKTPEEEFRVEEELLMFADRDMMPLLRYLKYLVDTMREHRILWGVGRGSSTASYVLYLIGIHRINPIEYNLSIDEFLK